jgi:hypothetical protein
MTNKLAVSQAMMQRMRRAIQREGLPFAGFRAHPDGSVTAVVGDPAQFATARCNRWTRSTPSSRSGTRSMAKPDLAGVHKVTSRGRTYYYAWREAGAPRLKGQPGTPEFVRSLREAHERRTAPDRTRMSGLCAIFRASDAWQGRGPKPLSESTKRSWRLSLDRIQEAFGELRIEQFDRPQMRPRIVKWRDGYAKTPRAADMGVQVLSRLLAHGQAEGLLLHATC